MANNDGRNTPPQRSVLLVMLAASAVAAGLWACGANWRSRAPARPASAADDRLYVDPRHLDFGEVWESRQFDWIIPIHNRSGQVIRIREFTSSCTCSKIEPPALVIPPHESRDVRLSLDLSVVKTVEDYRAAERPFRVLLSPRLEGDGEANSLQWAVQGRVKVPAAFEQPGLALGRHSELSQPLKEQTVTLTSHVPLKNLSASASSPHFQARVRRRDSTHFELTISQIERASQGPIKFEVSAIPTLEDGEVLPAKTLPVSGWIVEDIQTAPPVVIFGARTVGEVVEETVSLDSLTGRSFQVLGVKVEGDGLSAEKEQAEGLPSPAYRIKQKIGKAEEQSGRVTFRVRVAGGQESEVAVPVTYRGIAPHDP